MNKVKITEEERLTNIKRLEASYAMYEKSKNDTLKKYNIKNELNGEDLYPKHKLDETIELMNNMQEEVKEEYLMYGGSLEDLENMNLDINDNTQESNENEETHQTYVGDGVMEYLESLTKVNYNHTESPKIIKTYDFDTTKIKEAFDTIPLPSKGECYSNKLSKVPVAYLTAYDENIIVSPNLYRDGTFIDYLLKTKILNPAIDPDELLPGDRDAIILWLRATGYGNEFPVSVTDNETGREFNSIIDLSKINFKEFTLKGDENGWFTYVLPVSKSEVKFSFLTYKEMKMLNDVETKEDLSIRKNELKGISDNLSKLKKDDTSKIVTKQFLKRIDDAIKTIDEWHDSIEPEIETKISHAITNKMIASIKSIDGITDKKYIREFVVKMNIRDSASLRKYMLENEPGVDFKVEVERPKSLGGGSMETFLPFDQFIFLNYA